MAIEVVFFKSWLFLPFIKIGDTWLTIPVIFADYEEKNLFADRILRTGASGSGSG
jgi:hypothetical protein